ALLTKAGYDDGQIEILRGTINGETDEELAKAVDALKDVIAPKQNYIDPTPMNGDGGKPAKADKEELGAKACERIKNKRHEGEMKKLQTDRFSKKKILSVVRTF